MPTKEEVVRLLATLERNAMKNDDHTKESFYWTYHYMRLERLAKLAGLIS